MELELDVLEHEAVPRGVREGHGLEPDGHLERARRTHGTGARGRRAFEQVEKALGDGEPVGAGVKLRGEVAEREVELGREQEHRQRSLQPDAAVDEPHADGDRDQSDPERRGQLQDGSGEERRAQRGHGRAPVLVADRRDPLGLLCAPVERAERGEPADHVEKMAREHRQRPPAGAHAPLRVAADEPHEQRHERQRQQHQPGRERVDPGDEGEHGDGNDEREHELRQIARERRLEGVHTGDCERG